MSMYNDGSYEQYKQQEAREAELRKSREPDPLESYLIGRSMGVYALVGMGSNLDPGAFMLGSAMKDSADTDYYEIMSGQNGSTYKSAPNGAQTYERTPKGAQTPEKKEIKNNFYGVCIGNEFKALQKTFLDSGLSSEDAKKKAINAAMVEFEAATKEILSRERPKQTGVVDTVCRFYEPENAIKVAPVVMAASLVPYLGNLMHVASMVLAGSWVSQKKDADLNKGNKPDIVSRISAAVRNPAEPTNAVKLSAGLQLVSYAVGDLAFIPRIAAFAILGYSWWSQWEKTQNIPEPDFNEKQFKYENGQKKSIDVNGPENKKVADLTRARLRSVVAATHFNVT
jgi:hypothetical protein